MTEITNASIDAVIDTFDAKPDGTIACINITEPDDGSSSPPAIFADAFNLKPEVETITATLIGVRFQPEVAMCMGAT
jgi:hypothetical protein